jgi:hypothetical protein
MKLIVQLLLHVKVVENIDSILILKENKMDNISQKVKNQINFGNEMIKKSITTNEEFKIYREESNKWSNNNEILINEYFGENNQYIKKYKRKYIGIGAWANLDAIIKLKKLSIKKTIEYIEQIFQNIKDN